MGFVAIIITVPGTTKRDFQKVNIPSVEKGLCVILRVIPARTRKIRCEKFFLLHTG